MSESVIRELMSPGHDFIANTFVCCDAIADDEEGCPGVKPVEQIKHLNGSSRRSIIDCQPDLLLDGRE